MSQAARSNNLADEIHRMLQHTPNVDSEIHVLGGRFKSLISATAVRPDDHVNELIMRPMVGNPTLLMEEFHMLRHQDRHAERIAIVVRGHGTLNTPGRELMATLSLHELCQMIT